MKRVRRFVGRHFKLIIFCAIVVLVLILNQVFGWSAYLSDSGKLIFLSEMVKDNMLVASIIYIGLTIIACVVLALPGIVFAILAGAIFGPWLGTLLCLIATTIGAIASFIAGRYFLQDSIKPMVEKSPKLKKLLFDDIGRSDVVLLAITRLVPLFPYNLQNFAYGITDMSISHYSIYTFIFMIPGVALYTFGTAGIASDVNKVLYFTIAGGMLILTLLLAWGLKKKSEKVKISIILAVYNGENDVARCIESLRNQTHKDIEIICVDDGSTDGTLAILKEQAAQDSRIKVLEQGDNKKLLLAIKRGVKEATGDYIMFVDDDDWYELNACEKIVKIIHSNNPDVICFNANLVEVDGKPNLELKKHRERVLGAIDFKYDGENTLWLPRMKYNYIWNRAVRAKIAKRAYESIPNIELNYYSDCLACAAVHLFSKSLISTTEKLTNYNYNTGITSNKMLSAEQFAQKMKSAGDYENCVTKLLQDNNANEALKVFKDRYVSRVRVRLNECKNKVKESDYENAYERLVKYHDAEIVKLVKESMEEESHGNS